MDKSPIQLQFKCPKKWDSMTPVHGGRFCSDCKKVVKDFSSTSINKLSHLIPADAKEELCGNFKVYQLNNPFNDWRDKIISSYQKNLFSFHCNKLLRKGSILFFGLMIIVTGCTKRLRGCVAYELPKTKTKHNSKKEMVNEDNQKY